MLIVVVWITLSTVFYSVHTIIQADRDDAIENVEKNEKEEHKEDQFEFGISIASIA